MPFIFQRLEIPDVILIEPKIFGDPRGFFLETFKRSDFIDFGITDQFVQDNYSHSEYGVVEQQKNGQINKCRYTAKYEV